MKIKFAPRSLCLSMHRNEMDLALGEELNLILNWSKSNQIHAPNWLNGPKFLIQSDKTTVRNWRADFNRFYLTTIHQYECCMKEKCCCVSVIIVLSIKKKSIFFHHFVFWSFNTSFSSQLSLFIPFKSLM